MGLPMYQPTNLAVLFDLDGTLLDSTGDLADAANAARVALGLARLDDSQVECHVGHGLLALLEGAIPEVSPEERASAREHFIAHYKMHLLVRSRPYPGVVSMFKGLRGRRLGLVTNKPSYFTLPILDRLGWSALFQAVVCGDTLPVRKPSPEPVLHGCALLGAPPSQTVFVGDTVVDQEAALAAGCPFICVGWGRARLGTGYVVKALDELPAFISTHLEGGSR